MMSLNSADLSFGLCSTPPRGEICENLRILLSCVCVFSRILVFSFPYNAYVVPVICICIVCILIF